MDALSAVLGAVRLTGAVFLQVELRDQRSYLTAPSRTIADALMPDADHIIPYHLVTEGTCYARLLQGRPSTCQIFRRPQVDRRVSSIAK